MDIFTTSPWYSHDFWPNPMIFQPYFHGYSQHFSGTRPPSFEKPGYWRPFIVPTCKQVCHSLDGTPGTPRGLHRLWQSWNLDLHVTSSHFKCYFFSFLRWVKICGENHEQYLIWWLIINFRQTDVIWCVCSIFRHTHIINILWSCTGNHPITGWFTGKIPSAPHHDEWMIGLWNGNPQGNIEQPPSFSQNSIPGWNPSIRE